MGNGVTRFPNGVTNSSDIAPFADLATMDPTKFHTFFDDFDNYLAAEWLVTEVGVATQALADGDGGLLLITNAAADNDSSFQQWAGNAGAVIESFLMEAGKKAFFKARFKVSDATQSDFVMGLQIADTTPLAVTDGIYFIKDDGDAQLDILVQKDAAAGSNRVNNIATVANNTFLTVHWYYDGVDKVHYGVNDANIGSMNASSTYLPDAALAVSFGVQNGEAVAKTMTVDYIFAAKER